MFGRGKVEQNVVKVEKDVASLMDFAVPVVACLLVWLLVNRG
ncbi:hypothetical protein [Escherichia coli]|nr:hypothetical protein [Escherichia coli]